TSTGAAGLEARPCWSIMSVSKRSCGTKKCLSRQRSASRTIRKIRVETGHSPGLSHGRRCPVTLDARPMLFLQLLKTRKRFVVENPSRMVVPLPRRAVSAVRCDHGRAVHHEYFRALLFDDVRVFWPLVTKRSI